VLHLASQPRRAPLLQVHYQPAEAKIEYEKTGLHYMVLPSPAIKEAAHGEAQTRSPDPKPKLSPACRGDMQGRHAGETCRGDMQGRHAGETTSNVNHTKGHLYGPGRGLYGPGRGGYMAPGGGAIWPREGG